MLFFSLLLLCLLLLCSAFYSASETALMALNRYKIQHQSDMGNQSAKEIIRLIQQPQKIISSILLGNNFVNIAATSIGTSLCIRLFGEYGVLIATIFMTLLVLLFAEITPKTFAALQPEKVAYRVIRPLSWSVKLLSPLVNVLNTVVKLIYQFFGMDNPAHTDHKLSTEELKMVVSSAAATMPRERQNLLIGVLDLDEMLVDDAMVPRNEIHGIDLADDWNENVTMILQSKYTRLVVYRERIDDVKGILHLRDILHLMQTEDLSEQSVMQVLKPCYFVPEGTPLRVQLLNFQKKKEHTGLVVDEYGDIQGLVTLEDILTYIVGDIALDDTEEEPEIIKQDNGSYLIDGGMPIRQINRELKLNLPTGGSRTLSGLIIETLGGFPETNSSLQIGNCFLQVLDFSDGVAHRVRLTLREESDQTS